MNSLLRLVGRATSGKLLPRIAYPVLTGPLQGAKFTLGALEGAGGGASVYFNMVEPRQTKAFAEILQKGDVFFDVGANVGYYTVLGAQLAGAEGTVIAFEPSIRNLAYLNKHVKLNKLNNVLIIPAACSKEISLASFSASGNHATGHLSGSSVSEKSLENDLSAVLTVSLDIIAEHFGIIPNVLKIDVEGAEMLVLQGARNILRVGKPKIFLSTHSDALRSECLDFLGELGYKPESLSDKDEDAHEFLLK